MEIDLHPTKSPIFNKLLSNQNHHFFESNFGRQIQKTPIKESITESNTFPLVINQ